MGWDGVEGCGVETRGSGSGSVSEQSYIVRGQ